MLTFDPRVSLAHMLVGGEKRGSCLPFFVFFYIHSTIYTETSCSGLGLGEGNRKYAWPGGKQS